jgi:hypothetical protein
MTDPDNKEEKKIFVRGSPEHQEYLRTHPDAMAEYRKELEKWAEGFEELHRPSEEFKDKIRLLGSQMIDTIYNQQEKYHPRPLYAVNFYIMSLVDLVIEEVSEQIKADPEARLSILDITRNILNRALATIGR